MTMQTNLRETQVDIHSHFLPVKVTVGDLTEPGIMGFLSRAWKSLATFNNLFSEDAKLTAYIKLLPTIQDIAKNNVKIQNAEDKKILVQVIKTQIDIDEDQDKIVRLINPILGEGKNSNPRIIAENNILQDAERLSRYNINNSSLGKITNQGPTVLVHNHLRFTFALEKELPNYFKNSCTFDDVLELLKALPKDKHVLGEACDAIEKHFVSNNLKLAPTARAETINYYSYLYDVSAEGKDPDPMILANMIARRVNA